MHELTPELRERAGFPDELQPYLDNGTLTFNHAEANGTLDFTITNPEEPKSRFDLRWHPEDPETYDLEGLRFAVWEEKFRDLDHTDTCGDEVVDVGEDNDLDDLIFWLDQIKPA